MDFGQAPRSCTRVWLGVDSGDLVRTQSRHHVAHVAREGTLLRIRTNLPVHATCLDWSRFGRSGQTTNTASCVYTAMIEGMRYKVYLLLQGRVGAPSYGYGQSSPCMHSCLDWSRFGCSGQKTNTALCVYSAMIVLQRVCPNGLESRLESSKGVTPGQ